MTSHLKDVHEAIIRAWPEMTRAERREWLRENKPDYYVPYKINEVDEQHKLMREITKDWVNIHNPPPIKGDK